MHASVRIRLSSSWRRTASLPASLSHSISEPWRPSSSSLVSPPSPPTPTALGMSTWMPSASSRSLGLMPLLPGAPPPPPPPADPPNDGGCCRLPKSSPISPPPRGKAAARRASASCAGTRSATNNDSARAFSSLSPRAGGTAPPVPRSLSTAGRAPRISSSAPPPMRGTKRLMSGVPLPLVGWLSLSSNASPPTLLLAFADQVTYG